MPLEVAGEQPQAHQVVVDGAGLLERRPQDRRSVALGEHEDVGVGAARVLRVEAHLVEEQRGDDLGGGQARRGVTRAGFRRGGQGVPAQLLGHPGEDTIVDGHAGLLLSRPPERRGSDEEGGG
jgi:hypothetical protein